MSLIQILILALVFVVVMATAAGLMQLARPSEERRRLRMLVGGGPEDGERGSGRLQTKGEALS
jgi:hypothetical protein